MDESFEWPWQYSFPPFFTIQLNGDTRRKQLEAWCDLVLKYCKDSKTYILDVNEASSSRLFNNQKINRKLSLEAVMTVLEKLESQGNVEWQDKQKTRCLVMWRSPQEWGQLIIKWAVENGLDTSVCTLYEIQSGEDSEGEEFHGIEAWLLKKAIQALAQEGKAELIASASNEDADCGVKFFN